jgi:ribosomal protein L29
MTDNIEHLVLEQFRALRNQIAAMQTAMHSEFSDVKHRISRVETAIAGVRRDEAGAAEDIARQQVSIDQLNERIVRIERRLELRDG